MGGASLKFLAYGLLVAIVFNLSASYGWRQAVLLAASIAFLAFFSSSPAAILPLAGFLAFGFLSVRLLQAGRARVFLPCLIIGIVAFVWLKKYAFLPSSILLDHPYVTLGLSYIFFRVLHLIIDAHGSDLPGKLGLVAYLNYTLNFTTLVSGPIQRYQDFAEQQLVPVPIDAIAVGRALERIIFGYFKVNVLSLLLSMAQAHALSALGGSFGAMERCLFGGVIVAVYPLYLYCNFSGYIDIVIGLARLLRMKLPENFARPFAATNFLLFWNCWHITLSNWLKIYVYNPLLMASMRRWSSARLEPFLAVFAYFVTFFLIGLWHGVTSVFIFYGILLGLGISVNKLYQVLLTKRLGRKSYSALSARRYYSGAARGLTFTWFAFSLLWFWSNWTQLTILSRAFRWFEIAGVWIGIFIVASIALAAWEGVRRWALSLSVGDQPLLGSRYTRTVNGTICAVIALTITMLFNAPAPDIVYKAF